MAKGKNTGSKQLSDGEKKQAKIDNFARVAPRRMDKALKAIRQVGECSSVNYSYTTEQSSFLIAALREAIDRVEERYSSEPGKSAEFKLPE